jgi:hypothetical protein
MPSLSKDLRNQLSRVTLQARTAAEAACRAALENLAVHEKDYRGHMSVEQRQLRNRLRARGRALGDSLDERSGKQEIKHLSEDAAYEHWHRLLFTRFLTENHLLHTDEENSNVPVTLEDCEELAPDLGAKDGFDLACRFANRTLPGVFRTDDPVFDLILPPEWQVKLKAILDSLPTEVFTASDSLGWTYQFWQAERKDEVNRSGNKIGADEISPVTQLFTEDYMVDFLLDNTLGAWHAGKVLAANPKLAETAQSEEELRQAVALPGCPWKYLRFIKGNEGQWTPAAGTFDGWPKSAAELTCLDPCMGSGHFVVAMFERLVALRFAEEKLDDTEAVAAVIRDNLFGLEIDPRCTQIGAFNLALAAWRRVGHCKLPAMNLACSGLAPNTREADWLAIAGDNPKLQRGMGRLYRLFQKAAVLGSLINPRAGEGDLLVAAFHELQPLLEKALAQENKDDTAHEMAVTARGLAKAAEILASHFTLVATNVPYLGRGKQNDVLKDYCQRIHPDAKADLATCFLERCLSSSIAGGTTALITPQNWWFLPSYRHFRSDFLKQQKVNLAATLGEEAWQSFGDRGPVTVLLVTDRAVPLPSHIMFGIDALPKPTVNLKIAELQQGPIKALNQSLQLQNPDSRVMLAEPATTELLATRASSFQGIKTGDDDRVRRFVWELSKVTSRWRFFQGSVESTREFGGLDGLLDWGDGGDGLARKQGMGAWEKRGVMVSQMRELAVALYSGEAFDSNASPIVPRNESELLAIWTFCHSPSYSELVRKVDHSLKPTNRSLVQVPFDLEHWQKVAAEKYPEGLPTPFSSDPTQWLFNGHPKGSDQLLHVAVARLCGYRWPRQTGRSFPDCPVLGPDGLENFADGDGVVCLPALNREQPAAARLRALLAAALGTFDEKKLLATAGAKASTLEDWLRDECFEQHFKLFHHRPFLWHIWDGRKDGFSVLVNYHKLDHATLQKLTYTYLGNWIHDQESDAKADKPGAAERLGAAQALQAELAKILEGEIPYDLFVRWKPLKDQAIGWYPDLNDGVRLNIRPFIVAKDMGKKGAGILRAKPNVKWDKDRGKEPERPKSDYPWFWCEGGPGTDPSGGKTFTGNRWNDVHLSIAYKQTAH